MRIKNPWIAIDRGFRILKEGIEMKEVVVLLKRCITSRERRSPEYAQLIRFINEYMRRNVQILPRTY